MAEGLDRERLDLEQQKLRFERQKFATDALLKRRESSSRRGTFLRSIVTNPLALAIVGGFLTLMSGIVTTAYTSSENRKTAREAQQADLIKKFVEGPPEAVRNNLLFLVEAGLIPSYAQDIGPYLRDKSNPAPQVSARIWGGIVGPDDAVPATTLTWPTLRVSETSGSEALNVVAGTASSGPTIPPQILALT
jgi:hypothetical protein